jgi:hypothetical protein
MSRKRCRSHDVGRFSATPNILSKVPYTPCPIDNLNDMPYTPTSPLPGKNFAMYIVGSPGSGKPNLWISMMLSKKPIYYRKYFDMVELISGSLGTLPDKVIKSKKGVPSAQQSSELDYENLITKVNALRANDNTHNLIIFDDVIKDLSRNKTLSKLFLNRRHITHNPDKKGNASLSIMVTSQKYNLLPLEFRKNCSHHILFKTDNGAELKAIKEELMGDLSSEAQDKLLRTVWEKKYGFLFVDSYAPRELRYYNRFDLIQFD